MRKLIVLSFMTLDGIVQAPGGPEEDTSGGFRYGGWSFTYGDDFLGHELGKQMGHEFDLLLGRKTYDIFASYWPFVDTTKDPLAASIASSFNKTNKYVVSGTLTKTDWANSHIIKGDAIEEIRKLKQTDGPELQVQGSANLIQTLWKGDLVDELWLKTYPIMVGHGKRLFETGDFAGSFDLIEYNVSPSGVIIANYKRSGEVKTGSYA